MNQQTHYFYAMKIPDTAKLILKEHLETLKAAIPFSRWVHHQDLHITLAFLGNAPDEKLENSIQNVGEAVTSLKPFTFKINGLGIFGSQAAPRIFWAGTVECKELQALQSHVYYACTAAGFQLEKRAFRPHITLARKWTEDVPFTNEVLNLWNEIQPKPLEFAADEVVLYQTHLDRTPKYEVKQLFPLR